MQISPWQQNSYKLKTGESGQFELIGLPHGELTINYSGAILSLWVDRDISDGHFCLPLVDDEESEESDEEIGSTDNLILEFEDDEIPEAFVIDETELLD